MKGDLLDLPVEVQSMILSWVSSGTTLAYLSRCSKTLNRLCVPLLYRHLDIVINEVDQRVKIFWNTIKKPFGLRTDLPDCGRPHSGLGAKYDLQTIRLRYFLALFRDGHPCLSNVTDLEIEMEQESPDMDLDGPDFKIVSEPWDPIPATEVKELFSRQHQIKELIIGDILHRRPHWEDEDWSSMLLDFVRNLRVFRLRDVRTRLNGFASTQLLDAVLQGSRSLQILDIELADDGNLKSRDPLRNLYSLMHCSRAIPNRVIVWDSLTDLHLAGDDLGDLLDALTHQVTSGAIQPHLEKLRIRQRDQYHKYDGLYRFLATFSGLSWLSIVCRVEDAQTAHGLAADAICCHAASLEVLQVVYLDLESPWAQQAFDMQGLNEICEASHVLHTLNMSFEVRGFDSYTASEASHILYPLGRSEKLRNVYISVEAGMPEEAQLDNGKCLSRTSEPGYFSSMQSRGVIELLGQDLARFMEISGYDTCIWGFEIEEEERAR